MKISYENENSFPTPKLKMNIVLNVKEKDEVKEREKKNSPGLHLKT